MPVLHFEKTQVIRECGEQNQVSQHMDWITTLDGRMTNFSSWIALLG